MIQLLLLLCACGANCRVYIDPACTTYSDPKGSVVLDKSLVQQAMFTGVDGWRTQTQANITFTSVTNGAFDLFISTKECYTPWLCPTCHARGLRDPANGNRIYLHNGYIGPKHGQTPDAKWYQVFTSYSQISTIAMHEAGHVFFGNNHSSNTACLMNINAASPTLCPSEIAAAEKKWGKRPTISQWQNPLLASDVNGDGQVTANDRLRVINELNKPTGARKLTNSNKCPPWFDVNGDFWITPADVNAIVIKFSSTEEPIPLYFQFFPQKSFLRQPIQRH